MVDMHLDDLNFRIQTTQNEITRNEETQDRFISQFGKESEELLKKHDELCDTLEEYCAIRRQRGF